MLNKSRELEKLGDSFLALIFLFKLIQLIRGRGIELKAMALSRFLVKREIINLRFKHGGQSERFMREFTLFSWEEVSEFKSLITF